MKILSFEELEVDAFVVMTKAGASFPGLAHRLFRVVAKDDPYVVIETGGAPVVSRYTIVASEAEFAQPTKAIVEALIPGETVLDAEYIED